MRRWIIAIAAIVLLLSYIAAYRFLPWRHASRFRNAEVFVHTRDFPYEWEERLFYPAAFVEWLFIRAHPQPWLPHPSWAEYPEVLLLEGEDFRATFPRDAFSQKGLTNRSSRPLSDVARRCRSD
jgi:hypothetical protein